MCPEEREPAHLAVPVTRLVAGDKFVPAHRDSLEAKCPGGGSAARRRSSRPTSSHSAVSSPRRAASSRPCRAEPGTRARRGAGQVSFRLRSRPELRPSTKRDDAGPHRQADSDDVRAPSNRARPAPAHRRGPQRRAGGPSWPAPAAAPRERGDARIARAWAPAATAGTRAPFQWATGVRDPGPAP